MAGEEAAAVAKRIFALCVAGKGSMQIARLLTADRVLTVTACNARQKRWVMPDNLYQRNANAVVKILERREYTGCAVNLKTYTKSLKFKKRMENAIENRRIFEDTQPAIIERGQWERVQQLRPTSEGRKDGQGQHLLRPCALRGLRGQAVFLRLQHLQGREPGPLRLLQLQERHRLLPNPFHLETGALRLALTCIRHALTYVRMFHGDFIQEMPAQDEASRRAEPEQKRRMLTGARRRMKDPD